MMANYLISKSVRGMGNHSLHPIPLMSLLLTYFDIMHRVSRSNTKACVFIAVSNLAKYLFFCNSMGMRKGGHLKLFPRLGLYKVTVKGF